MMKKTNIKTIQAAYLSPVFVVHGPNQILSLLQQDKAAQHPAF